MPEQAPRSGVLSAGRWNFKHVAEGSGDHPGQTKGCWYLAWTDEEAQRRLWRLRSRWGRAKAEIPELADAAKEVFGVYPQVVEPNRLYPERSEDSELPPLTAPPIAEEPPLLKPSEGLNSMWPSAPADQLYRDYLNRSGLLKAQEVAGAKTAGVRVAILDDGFDVRHQAMPEPERLVDEPGGDAVGFLGCALGAGCRPKKPGSLPSASGHGSGPLGILAGREVRLPGEQSARRLGVLSHSPVILVKVSPWVASVSTANLAYGLDYASRVQKADVISMSHGGSPSLMWADTVNAAYERGTLIVGAAANHFNHPLLPWGLLVPSTTLYPAAFNRVQGVSGVTYDEASYSRTSFRHFLRPWNWSNPFKWIFMRGNYGPDGYWRSFHPFGPPTMERIEQPTVEAGGVLRAHQLCAYTPNIPWITPKSSQKSKEDSLLEFSPAGGGTSSATPQVAGAAALWLAEHKREIERSGQWQSWQKAEAAMLALLATADRTLPGVRHFTGNEGRRPEDQQPDLYLGAGVIRADRAMALTFAEVRALQGKTLRFPNAPTGVPRDRFDGDHSLARLLIRSFDFSTVHPPSQVLRLRMDKSFDTVEQRRQALENLYFNLELLRQWQWGRVQLQETAKTSEERPRRTRWLSRLLTKDASEITREAAVRATKASSGR